MCVMVEWGEEITQLSETDGLRINTSVTSIVVWGFFMETEYKGSKLVMLCEERLWKGLNSSFHVFQLPETSSGLVFIKLVILAFLGKGFQVSYEYFHSYFNTFCLKICNKFYVEHVL